MISGIGSLAAYTALAQRPVEPVKRVAPTPIERPERTVELAELARLAQAAGDDAPTGLALDTRA